MAHSLQKTFFTGKAIIILTVLLLKGGVIVARVIRENEIGILECIDGDTGDLIWKQLPSKSMLKRMAEGKPIRMKNKPDSRTLGGRPSAFAFSAYYAAIITEKVIEGHTILAIGKMSGMPPASTIYYWSKRYRDFGLLLKQARECRADLIFDRIIDLTDQVTSKNIQATKAQVETLKWVYEKSLFS